MHMQMSAGTTSLTAASSFLGTWMLMTVAMMSPSLAPALWRYNRAVRGAGALCANRLTTMVAAAYFAVWSCIGVAVYALGAALAAAERQLPALAQARPLVVAFIVVIAGVLQFTGWKAGQLSCWGELSAPCGAMVVDAAGPWRHGQKLAAHCVCSCAGPMAALLAVGMMDLRTMAVVTVLITVERFASTEATSHPPSANARRTSRNTLRVMSSASAAPACSTSRT